MSNNTFQKKENLDEANTVIPDINETVKEGTCAVMYYSKFILNAFFSNLKKRNQLSNYLIIF